MTTAFALIVLAQQGDQTAVPTVSDVITNVVKKYQEAESVTGLVTMTQMVADKKVQITTRLQAQRPNKLYLVQESSELKPGKWTVISDGAFWRYDAPSMDSQVFTNAPPQVEPTAVNDNATGQLRILKFNDFFIGSRKSLGDTANPFLEFTMHGAGTENSVSLRGFINRLQKLSVVVRKLKDGTDGWALKGTIQWGIKGIGETKSIGLKEDYDRPAKFEMQLTKNWDLRRVQTVETVRITPEGSNVPTDLNISTVWEGDLKINGAIDQALFTIK